ncbi:MAG: hypothetical protein IVW36_01540 [Dehalococcoidia bacterium]|nr:hypothetical protein [Dehalococcoidia bacterium]
MAVAATGRTRPVIASAINGLAASGILIPLSDAPRNRASEAGGLLDLVVALEAGEA